MSESSPPRKFRIADAARDEIFQIWSDIAALTGSFDAADKLIDAIVEKYALIEQFPNLGRSREEIAPGVRSFVARSGYVIYYRVTTEAIEIAHVAHGARLPENVFGTGEI